MDRILTNEEKMKLLEIIVLNGNLSEIEKVLIEIKNKDNNVNKDEVSTLNNTNSNNFDVASIYSKEALPFVNADLESHPIVNAEQVIDEQVSSETKEGPVLKKTIPNPWGEAGAKRVSPGDNLDY